MNACKPIFSELAAQFLVSLPKRRQKLLLQRARELAQHPFFESDYAEQDPEGRTIDHLVVEHFVFAYWIDHGSRSVMIVEVEEAR